MREVYDRTLRKKGNRGTELQLPTNEWAHYRAAQPNPSTGTVLL